MSKKLMSLAQSELGKKSRYDSEYDPCKLLAIPRHTNRAALGIDTLALPFYGFDVWNHYEVSWLNAKGKPVVALAEIIYNCDSVNIIESKSMKLYFNSLNNTIFPDVETLQTLITKDLAERLQTSFITVRLTPLSQVSDNMLYRGFKGVCLDELDISCSVYQPDPAFLTTENDIIEETVYSDLLKSNCLVTQQPDWSSVQISYQGKKIQHEGLLRYLVSFRNANEFHEPCIEKIFLHIMQYCGPHALTINGRTTRRGGIDINSCRSTRPLQAHEIPNLRLCRQ